MGEKLNAISLFSGIGGFELGIGDYCQTVLYCEADQHAQAVLLSRMAEGAIDYAPICTDVREITGEFVDVPIDIIFGGFPCFVKDTMVFTKDGYKAIQDIEVGEYVLTHKRRWRTVTKTHVTENRQIRLVDGTGFLVTETTDEHPYYVRKSKRVWDNNKRRYHREFTDPQFVEARELQGLHVGMTFIPDTIDDEHSEDFWWLIGRCLACGWCVERHDRSTEGYAKVIVSCGRHRAEELEERINRCFHFTKEEDRAANKYHITNKDFADFFSKADIGALNKHIPNDWLMLPKEKLSALLDGYFSGDGSAFVSKSGREGRRCTTVSKRLALTLQMAILKCYGVVPSLFYYEVPETTVIEGRIVNQHPQYQVQYADFNRSSYVDISGEYGWGVCRKSDGTDKFETVYNIAVEEDESYIANGAIVHNCQDISVAGKGVGLLGGERSILFFEIVRLAEELQPAFLFLENVPAIRTRGLDRVIQELTKIGYDIRWTMLSASDVGASHKRERWFLLAHMADSEKPRVQGLWSGREQEPHAHAGSSILMCQGEGRSKPHPLIEPHLGRVADGISVDVEQGLPDYLTSDYWQEEPQGIPRVTEEREQRVERIKRLGNAVVPLQVRTAFEYLVGLKCTYTPADEKQKQYEYDIWD